MIVLREIQLAKFVQRIKTWYFYYLFKNKHRQKMFFYF